MGFLSVIVGFLARGERFVSGPAVVLALTLVMAGAERQAIAAPISTLLQFNTNVGTWQVDLFDGVYGTAATTTPGNFLSHVTQGHLDNTIIHRVQRQNVVGEGFGIVQGGGFKIDPVNTVVHTGPYTPITLQYGLSNRIGTITMARTGNPTSATTEWFVNTTDNTTTLGQANNGGYAVFGQVMARDLHFVTDINKNVGGLPTTTLSYTDPTRNPPGQSLPSFPLRNWTTGDPVTSANYLITNSVTVVRTHPTFQNPVDVTDVNNDGGLTALDVSPIVTSLLNNGPRSASQIGSIFYYLDPDGNGRINALDASIVIQKLLRPPSGSATAQFSIAPEPSSWAMGALALAALGAVALRRRKQARVLAMR
jgi:MYXO-CTERM domain-containing protein